MGRISVSPCGIDGLFVVESAVHGDERGWFMESYNRRDFFDAGLDMDFVQDNCSRSERGVLRGLHYQTAHPQGKLVRVSAGEVFDVAVDLRPGSAAFGKWEGVFLSGENKKQFYIPPGFAHGFYVLSGPADFQYKVTDYYCHGDEGGIMWNDPDIAVDWPIPAGMTPVLSPRDRLWKSFKESFDR